jgi:hypothetical protein
MNRLALGPPFAALLATCLLLGPAPASLRAQAPAVGSPSPCASSPSTVQAPAAGALQVPGGFAAAPAVLNSLGDAAAAYDAALLIPTEIPEGFELGQIEYFHTRPPAPQVDELVICYYDGAGNYLEILQGIPAPQPAGPAYLATPEDQRGTVAVQGQTAYWNAGELVPTGSTVGIPNPSAPSSIARTPSFVWQPGPLQLTLQTDVDAPRPPGAFAFVTPPGSSEPQAAPPAKMGYQLTSDSLSLDDLIAIANSVRPYTGDSGS